MDEWDLDEIWQWGQEEYEDLLLDWAEDLGDLYFVSDDNLLPNVGQAYSLGYVSSQEWLPLVNQLEGIADLAAVVSLSEDLDDVLGLSGLPTELLETPLGFLETVLEGNLPLTPSGRKVDSRRLVKIALLVIGLAQAFPAEAQAAVRAWADMHRMMAGAFRLGGYDEDLGSFLFGRDMPPPVTGFTMLIVMTLMRWPERAEGVPLPPGFLDPNLYADLLADWVDLDDSAGVMDKGAGFAEALFAQGQLAYVLAELGTVEGLDPDPGEDDQQALVYSRLSRGMLWVHNQCRSCAERESVECRVATPGGHEPPVPLLDVASQMANEGRIDGCVKL